MLVAVYLAQAPALRSFFMFDDYLHLYQLANLGAARFLVTPHAEHVYLVRNAIFALLHALFGMRAELYLGVTLATHLLNVALLFVLLRRLFGSPWIATLASLAWGTCPIWRDVIGWYSAHGMLLVATILLVLLCDLVRVRPVGAGRLALWYVLLIASPFCHGAGLVLPVVFPALVWLLAPDPEQRRPLLLRMLPAAVGVPLLYFALHRALAALEPEGVTSLQPFGIASLGPAMETILSMAAYGLNVLVRGPSAMAGTPAVPGIHAGRIAVAVAIGLLLAWQLRRSSARDRRRLLAFALVSAASYGLIVVGRIHVASAAHRSLEWLATTPRYQYCGSIGLVLALSWGGSRLARGATRARVVSALAASFWVLLLFHESLGTPFDLHWADYWRAQYREASTRIDGRIRRSPPDADVFLRNRAFDPAVVAAGSESFPGYAGVFVLTYPENEVAGRRVFFVDSDADVVARARAQPASRASGILITRDECGDCLSPRSRSRPPGTRRGWPEPGASEAGGP